MPSTHFTCWVSKQRLSPLVFEQLTVAWVSLLHLFSISISFSLRAAL
ncbi:MAG: hypothetical protein IJE79_05405 [Alphaproteobacteria bacterium]|nr:hypothetical protein [Alphaproteobacteria bacterium]